MDAFCREHAGVETLAAFLRCYGPTAIEDVRRCKAAVEASRAVRAGGTLILAANNKDRNPVGGPPHCRRLLPMLTELGTDELERRLLSAGRTFVPEQWELQM